METIRTYLENMFMQLPPTPEILRAKEELLSMMEDKYEELKNQGKAENKAVGTVIAEFGNLDEILQELGVKNGQQEKEYYHQERGEGRTLSFQEVKEYLDFKTKFAIMISVGVALCIISPVTVILLSGNRIGELLGVLVLFVFIAAAVGIFIYYGMQAGKYQYLEKEVFSLDWETEQMLQCQAEEKRSTFAVQIVMGVGLCILSVIPPILIDALFADIPLAEHAGAAILLVMVAAGVFCFIYAGITKGSFSVLLQQEEYSPREKKKKESKVFNAVSSCYWTLATVAYFIWSFGWRAWGISWVIWPVAGVLWGMISSLWGVAGGDERKDK